MSMQGAPGVFPHPTNLGLRLGLVGWGKLPERLNAVCVDLAALQPCITDLPS